MGRKKREPLNPEKKNIIAELIKTYEIKTAQDIQDALKDLSLIHISEPTRPY